MINCYYLRHLTYWAMTPNNEPIVQYARKNYRIAKASYSIHVLKQIHNLAQYRKVSRSILYLAIL
jgi:hypothetical protein